MLDAAASRAAKEEGMQLAIDFAGEWKDLALEELERWLRGQGATVTIEQFRAVAKCQPPRHQAWGPFARLAKGRGLIAPAQHLDGSPVYRLAESVKTHSHPIRVYRNLSFSPLDAQGANCPKVNLPHASAADYGENRATNVGRDPAAEVRGGGLTGLLGFVQASRQESEAR